MHYHYFWDPGKMKYIYENVALLNDQDLPNNSYLISNKASKGQRRHMYEKKQSPIWGLCSLWTVFTLKTLHYKQTLGQHRLWVSLSLAVRKIMFYYCFNTLVCEDCFSPFVKSGWSHFAYRKCINLNLSGRFGPAFKANVQETSCRVFISSGCCTLHY